MKILRNELKKAFNIRTEKDFPKKGIEFIDINPLIIQQETFAEVVDHFTEEIKQKDIDYIIAPEARGFLIGSAIANRLNVGFIPVRKKGKMPPTTVEKQIVYQKEYGEDILELPKLIDGNYSNKNFYIVDDIYATGNTAQAIAKAIEELGGKVEGIGVIINIKELNNDEVFSLIDVNEE